MPPRFSGLTSPGAAVDPNTAPAGDATGAIVPKVTKAKPARRRFVSQIPASIAEDPLLLSAMEGLPSNYNFEVAKTIWRLRQMGARAVALQFPEGLLLYACTIADIIERFACAKGVCEVVILGDVTYGACCVDDLCAAALGCDLLVHYGHSCLVPISKMATDVMYVFVEVTIDTAHLVDTVCLNFPPESKLALCGTIQFGGALNAARTALVKRLAAVQIPQCKPLSAGEVLGCTAPYITGCDAVVFVADGRFHPEAVMVANPQLPLFRYDPYSKTITRERYEHERMHSLRRDAVRKAQGARHWGLVLGTLGRQGSPEVLRHLQKLLELRGHTYSTVLLSEVFPSKLAAFPTVEAWIQAPPTLPPTTPHYTPPYPNPTPKSSFSLSAGLLPSPLYGLGAPF